MSQATKLLGSALRLGKGERGVVWIDENTRIRELEKAFSANSGLYGVTNRLDLANGLEHWAKGRIKFNDFEAKGFGKGSLDLAGLRVGKEKALAHHLINQSWTLLKLGGRLALSGNRTEGIKSYVEKAKLLFGGKAEVRTTQSGARVALIEKRVEEGDLLDDRGYKELREFEGERVGSFVSKPGVFAWNKEDEGSVFLSKQMGNLDGKSVLDLGCGYGFLAMVAALKGAKRIVATDNSATAILAAERNLKNLEAETEVVASDAGKGLSETFDALVCNPPFHQGKGEQRGLTRKFGRNIAKRLNADGVGYVVVNSFIPFAKDNAEFFSSIETLANNGGYKVHKCSPQVRT